LAFPATGIIGVIDPLTEQDSVPFAHISNTINIEQMTRVKLLGRYARRDFVMSLDKRGVGEGPYL
jgi:hypothetical protein